MSSRYNRNVPPVPGPGANADTAEQPVELENQFLLRLPEEPAAALSEAIRAGAGNLKERLLLKLEPDPKNPTSGHLRKGHLKFDGWNMKARLMDLPTILESKKTIDKKTFYKTADISQILICKEENDEDDNDSSEEEDEEKPNARKDPIKVDKKFIYNHGVCPPLKNCRKRRFRKTLKKKSVDAPEIEKEVKRLLREDCAAVKVKWDLVANDDEVVAQNQVPGGPSTVADGAAGENPADGAPGAMSDAFYSSLSGEQPSDQPANDFSEDMNVKEGDLFGDLTDSD